MSSLSTIEQGNFSNVGEPFLPVLDSIGFSRESAALITGAAVRVGPEVSDKAAVPFGYTDGIEAAYVDDNGGRTTAKTDTRPCTDGGIDDYHYLIGYVAQG